MSTTAYDIKEALSLRHMMDFFSTEVMNGPSARGGFRFDAVAIKKSWSTPAIIGYEVKVSRSDFKADNKFYAYLPYFHELYIACPKGMIQREELPDSIGLMWFNPETKEVKMKKRAIWRNIDIDPTFLMHIFFNHLSSDRTPFHFDRADYCRRYIEDRESMHDIGNRLGTKMAKRIQELETIVSRMQRAGHEPKALDEIREVMHKHSVYGWNGNEAAELDKALSLAYPPKLNGITEAMRRYVEQLENICIPEDAK
jgi:hypothetical protein